MSKEVKYEDLRKINVNEHVEKKGRFNYLSWSCALDLLLENDPDATWEYKNPMKFQDGMAMVFCSVTAFGRTRTMQLPVLNYNNKAIENPSAFDMNTAMQRCLAKAIACHGIGLYIYKGEDLPPDEDQENTDKKAVEKPKHQPKQEKKPSQKKMTPLQEKYSALLKQIKECDSLDVLEMMWTHIESELSSFPDAGQAELKKQYDAKLAELKG